MRIKSTRLQWRLGIQYLTWEKTKFLELEKFKKWLKGFIVKASATFVAFLPWAQVIVAGRHPKNPAFVSKVDQFGTGRKSSSWKYLFYLGKQWSRTTHTFAQYLYFLFLWSHLQLQSRKKIPRKKGINVD